MISLETNSTEWTALCYPTGVTGRVEVPNAKKPSFLYENYAKTY